MLYQWQEPWVSDWSGFEGGVRAVRCGRTLDGAIATTLDWWRGELAVRAAAKAA